MSALAFYREAVEPLGKVTGEDADGDGTPEKDYQVDFGRWPVLLDLACPYGFRAGLPGLLDTGKTKFAFELFERG